MALRRASRRRVLLAAPLLLLALLWAQPTEAFLLTATERSVQANVVAASSAYVTETASACSGSRVVPTQCTFTIHNKASAALTFSVTKESDPDGVVTGSSVSGNPVSPGGSATVTVNLKACFACPTSTTTHWTIIGANAGVLDARHTRYAFAISY